MKFSIILALLMFISVSDEPVVKLKKGIVYVDGTECLKYDRSDPNDIVISTLDDSQTMYVKYIHGSKYVPEGKSYIKIIFVESRKSMTTATKGWWPKHIVENMIKMKVLENCRITESAIDKFIFRFDENVEQDVYYR